MSKLEGPAASRRAMLHSLAGTAASLAAAQAIARPTTGKVAGDGAGASTPRRIVYLDEFLDEAQRAAAVTDTPRDCTAAFERALATGCPVEIGAGHYAVHALRLPNGCSLTGHPGAVIHQALPDQPAVHCVSDERSGQLADIRLSGITFVGHPAARAVTVLLEARRGYAIWRSRFSFFARNSFRALEVQAIDNNNVFECEIDVVSEGSSGTAVLVNGGTYNRYHLFLTRTRSWALDDLSNNSMIRVVSENCVVFRGQMNQIQAHIEAISADRGAGETAISDRGFGNSFIAATVNMPAGDRGKLRYAFGAFQRSVFINPQIIGAGAPAHPFAPTSNFPFTVIGGRSLAANKIEATFDGADPDHDLRNVTFVGDVSDFTTQATHPSTTVVQRFAPGNDETIRIAATTRTVIIDAARVLPVLTIAFPTTLKPRDGWRLVIATSHAITEVRWPAGPRFSRLPSALSAEARIDMTYQGDVDRWFVT
nr:hypothetical protein [Sphingomonas sp. H160509]